MRIVIRSPDARRARHLQERLDAAGFPASAMIGPSAWRPAPEGEDLTIVEAPAAAEAQALREKRHPTLAIVAATGLDAPPDASASAPFDGCIALDAPPESLARRLSAIFRDAVCAAELDARKQTAEAAGLAEADEPEPELSPSVMFVGGPAPMFLALERAFAQLGARTAAALTSFSAFDHLNEDSYSALVINALEDSAQALSLAGAMRRNARLYHLPSLVIAKAKDKTTATAAFKRGADHVCTPSRSPLIAAGWLMEDVRRNRARLHVRRALAASPLLRPGLHAFDAEGFQAHLERLALRHHEWGRPLAIGVLSLGDAAEDEAWKRGFAETVSLSSRLVRASDAAATLDAQTLAFAFPCSDIEAANIALTRIIAVCECTAFVAGDNGRKPLALSCRTAELAPGESGAGLLARTLDMFLGRAA